MQFVITNTILLYKDNNVIMVWSHKVLEQYFRFSS